MREQESHEKSETCVRARIATRALQERRTFVNLFAKNLVLYGNDGCDKDIVLWFWGMRYSKVSCSHRASKLHGNTPQARHHNITNTDSLVRTNVLVSTRTFNCCTRKLSRPTNDSMGQITTDKPGCKSRENLPQFSMTPTSAVETTTQQGMHMIVC